MISVVLISKDEPALADTLLRVQAEAESLGGDVEVIVVDASQGHLDHIRDEHPEARWLPFRPPEGVAVSIPHQRNAGVAAARGDIVVFTDAGCIPRDGWLAGLTGPIASGEERVTAGPAYSPDGNGIYDSAVAAAGRSTYLDECPTINLAFRRSSFDEVSGFDERFEYGSDVDFSWRLVDSGARIRSLPEAAVTHDWGDPRRQLRRSYRYGRARARLYAKHRDRLRRAWRADPLVLAYPLFLLGLPLTLRFRAYPLLLALPAWRNRSKGSARVLVDHLAFGSGVLREVVAR